MDLVRPDDAADSPRYPGGLGDHATSQSLLAGIGMALFHKERTGRGQLVDACLFRTGLWCMGVPILLAQHGYGKVPRRGREDQANPAFNSYYCKDGVGVQVRERQRDENETKTRRNRADDEHSIAESGVCVCVCVCVS